MSRTNFSEMPHPRLVKCFSFSKFETLSFVTMLSAFRLFLTALPSELKERLIGVNVGQVCFASYRLKNRFLRSSVSTINFVRLAWTALLISCNLQNITSDRCTTLNNSKQNFDSKDYRAKFRIRTSIYYWAALWTTMATVELLRSRNWHTFQKHWFKNQEI